MVLRFLKLSLIVMFVAAVTAVGASAATIALRPNATWMERAAAGDLQRVIYAATGGHLVIGQPKPGEKAVIAIGFSPASGVDLSRKTLGDQGFVLKTIKNGGKMMVVAAGATPVANAYAAYTLAEKYGAGFYLGGDALPQKKHSFSIPDLNIVQKPALAIRGVLPWYNFFDSPTAWNIDDYRSFIDQLAKAKNNFIGFHSYDYEPFCAYKRKDGELGAGAPLVSTAQPTWGTASMKTSDFAAGTGKYFTKEYFGADCSMGYKTPEEGIQNARKLLADALNYAKARGLKTCLGFEVSGDPTLAASLDQLELRLKDLVHTYPTVDYVWIWEPEAMGSSGVSVRPARSDYGAYYRRFNKAFSDIKEPNRKSEAVRMAIYALAAHRILEREAPRVKMVLSGWGGDKHLHFTDFYPGLDKVLPKDIIFSALDNIVVSDTVSSAYGKLSKDREFWPIPWFEYDGDQWFPQPNTKQFAGAAGDALKKGAKGLLGIHWRTRDVEESHAFMSQFAWNPKLSYQGFYNIYAAKAFGSEKAASLLMDLQDLGYRWTNTGGQAECGGFAWSNIYEASTQKITDILDKYKDLPASERLDILKATRDWSIAFNNTIRALSRNGLANYPGAIRTYDPAKIPKPSDKEIKGLQTDLNEGCKSFEQGILAYAHRISNRGELGVLATINAKAWANLLVINNTMSKIAGVQMKTGQMTDSGPLAVNSILRLDTAFSGTPLNISALIFGASPSATAEVVYRAPGKQWKSAKLTFANSGRLEGAIPASDVTGDLLEYSIHAADKDSTASWPADGSPASVSVVPKPADITAQVKPLAASRFAVGKITYTPGPMLLQLKWNDVPGVREFRILRQADLKVKPQVVGVTRDTWYEDRNVKCGAKYRYEVVDADSGRKIAQVSDVTLPAPPAPSTPKIQGNPSIGKVRLKWAADDAAAVGYNVYRSENPDGPFELIKDTAISMSPSGICTCACPANSEQALFYIVKAYSGPGKESTASNSIMATALEPDFEPVFQLAFTGSEPDISAKCVIEDGRRAGRTGGEWEISMPYQGQCDLTDEITLEFWVKLTDPGVMPVLISRGFFGRDGYFLQYYNGKIRFYLADVGTLDAGKLDIGRWTHVAATYDGEKMVIYVDGKPAGSLAASGPIRSAQRSLHIGRYDVPAAEYEASGFFSNVCIYSYALSADTIKADYDQSAPQAKAK